MSGAQRDIYLSFFMFTANLQPGDDSAAQRWIGHIHKMRELGYAGFDLPVAPVQTFDHRAEIDHYKRLREAFDRAGLDGVRFTTNVGATSTFDPTSPYPEQRRQALAYLKSRVEITRVLDGNQGDTIMAGPFLYPYGLFPTLDSGDPLWSDALQDWLAPRYPHAVAVFDELADFAVKQKVKLAIEPVDHWETPGPNTVSDVLAFTDRVKLAQVGATFDTAHIVLGSTGPETFRDNVKAARKDGRLHYVHISPPDRGALKDSWIPWAMLMPEFLQAFSGPYLIEVFNAVPPFDRLMRLTRRKFWIPGEDQPVAGVASAYEVAKDGIEILRAKIAEYA
ncbi:sugar phosphate isomerase/epimerase family protein [uncultured Rhodoblastus sp.]|uniref:sugar phosphate isomerase/epimerase family protein n=1 Tax=uncultured Rhodoblastus sp. TaxID=543037 RepID=UPI002600772C|nr:sugar phosphate isomerase/epimerase family protein [uncultured Rhodoblastus sp.]